MTGTNKLVGLNITGTIVPTDAADTFATHDSLYGKGGWREVDTIAERDAIPAERRKVGMVVFVKADYTNYQLKGTLDNDGWVVFGSSDPDGEITKKLAELDRDVTALNTRVDNVEDKFDSKADASVVTAKFTEIEAVIDTLETKEDAATHLKKEDLEPYAKTADIASTYATKEALESKLDETAAYAAFATKEELDGYVSDTEIKAYAKKTDLEPYAKTTEVETAIADKADKTELTEYAKTEYIESNYVSNEDLTEKVEQIMVTYVAPEIVSFAPSVAKWEKGNTANITLNWTLNKTVTYQELNQGIGEVLPSARSQEIKNITSNTEYQLTVDDGTKEVSAKTEIKFLPACYWGVSTKETLDNADILAFSKELLESREQIRIFDCSEGAYFYIVLQEDLVDDDILFKVSGSVTTALEQSNMSVTNAYGFTTNYVIYRSTNMMTGAKIPVEVI